MRVRRFSLPGLFAVLIADTSVPNQKFAAVRRSPGGPDTNTSDKLDSILCSELLVRHTGPVDVGPSLRDLGCLAAVARRLSFSRAAAELGLSQPAVSHAIARLERSYGLRLLDRTSREVRLTAAGRSLLPRVEALLEHAEAVTAEAQRLTRASTIRLAYDRLAGGLAARVARRLADRKPSLDVELCPAGWAAAAAALADGSAAAAIMSTPFPPGLASTARFHVPVRHLAVRAGTPLATATQLRPDQLFGHEILLPAAWNQLRPRFGPTARVTVVEPDEGALDLVAAGRGVLPTPHLVVETVRRPDVRFVPLALGDAHLTYALVWDQDDPTPETMALVQAVQETLRTRSALP
jgi:DNA-binding transcriptional LysR family regulator